MKAILFYSSYSAPELQLKAKIEADKLNVECIDIMTMDNPFKQYIRATPALITITDDVQGEFLQDETVDTETYLRGLLAQAQDKEEEVVHKQKNNRIDQLINDEKKKSKQEAEDAFTLELIQEGLL